MTTFREVGWWLLGHPLHAVLAGCLLAGVMLLALVLCMRRVNLDDVAGPTGGVRRVDQLHDVGPERLRLRPDWRADVTGVVAVPLPPRADEGRPDWRDDVTAVIVVPDRADQDLAVTRRLSWARYGMAHAVPPDLDERDPDDRPGRHRRSDTGTARW